MVGMCAPGNCATAVARNVQEENAMQLQTFDFVSDVYSIALEYFWNTWAGNYLQLDEVGQVLPRSSKQVFGAQAAIVQAVA